MAFGSFDAPKIKVPAPPPPSSYAPVPVGQQAATQIKKMTGAAGGAIGGSNTGNVFGGQAVSAPQISQQVKGAVGGIGNVATGGMIPGLGGAGSWGGPGSGGPATWGIPGIGGIGGPGSGGPATWGAPPGVGSIPGLGSVMGGTGIDGNVTGALGDIGAELKNLLGTLTPTNAIDSLGKITGMSDAMRGETNTVNADLDAAGNQYAKDVTTDTRHTNNEIAADTKLYSQGQDALASRAKTSSNQAGELYQSTDKSMADLQGQTGANAHDAMSLADAGDVNSSMQKDVRGLYNKEGSKQFGDYVTEGDAQRAHYNTEGRSQQQAYEQQAQGVGRQGLADTGVLAALGSQAMAGQMGGASPMTGGQLQAMQGANMGRAGQAYARAQQQMQGLRDQGMGRNMDLRTQGIGNESALRSQGMGVQSQLRGQGIDQGFNQSGAQYDRGQGAIGMASNVAQARQGMGSAYQGLQQGLRGEQSGYQGNRYQANIGSDNQQFSNSMNDNGVRYGVQYDTGARQQAAINSQYQPKMAAQGQMANIYGQYGVGMMGMAGDFAKAVGGAVPLGGGTGG